MNLLIVYASNSGSTYLVAKHLNQLLSSKEHNITLKKASETTAEDFEKADVILMGSPSWKVKGKEGQPHETMSAAMEKMRESNLNGKYFALFGCGDRAYLNFCNAVDMMGQFVDEVGGLKIVDPLKIDSYFFFQEQSENLTEEWAHTLNNSLPVSNLV